MASTEQSQQTNGEAKAYTIYEQKTIDYARDRPGGGEPGDYKIAYTTDPDRPNAVRAELSYKGNIIYTSGLFPSNQEGKNHAMMDIYTQIQHKHS